PYTTIDLHLVHPSGVPRSTYLRQLLRETKIRRSIFSPPHHAAPAACCGLVLLRRSQRASYTGMKDLWLPRTVLEADFLVSMPKIKTHHWSGVTLSMKNMFGVVPGA